MDEGRRPGPAGLLRRILFYPAGIIVIPLLFFAGMEGILTLFDVADPFLAEDPYLGFKGMEDLFVEDPEDADRVMINPKRALWHIEPDGLTEALHLQGMKRVKGERGYRIFLFGGSNTFNFQTEIPLLLKSLKGAFPERGIEVINLGGKAFGTHRIVLLMEEALIHDPDLLFVYSGNNEFMEKRFYEEILNEPKWLTGVRRFLRRFRFYILLRGAIHDLFPLNDEGGRPILEKDVVVDLIPYKEKRFLEEIMEQYEFNLRRMARLAGKEGVRLVLSTVPSRDMTRPYAPCYQEEIGKEANERLRRLMEEVGRLLSHPLFEEVVAKVGRFHLLKPMIEEAGPILEEARSIYPMDADLLYWSGFIEYFDGDFEEARRLMLASTEGDCSPRRSTLRTNAIVRKVAKEYDLYLLDAVELIGDHSPHNISFGREEGVRDESKGLFYDHCHLNNIGRKLLLESLADTIIREGWME